MTRTYFKKRAAALAVASCLSLTPWLAEAASLGKITVLSGLGQPLRAEIELSATRAELNGMSARLAAMTAFREAGIDYAPVLLDLRFAIDRRSNGTQVVKVSSAKPINDPFIDVLVELSWPSGPLLREYTFLLDPPEVAAKAAARQAQAVEPRVVQGSAAGGAPNGNAASPAAAPVTAPRAAAPLKKSPDSATRVVEKGETLRKIAGETKYEGVTLEQMLLGIYRRNPSAFVGENINRMKAGAILNIPEKEVVTAIPAAEARQVYVTQTGDWNVYRQKLAAATAQAKPGPEAAAQSATGKITAKVEDKPSAVDQAKDQVKVSRTEMAGKGAAGGKPGKAEEELIAKDQALKEAEARVALLEKNVSELQKLVDLKTQLLAELQQQAAARKDGAAPAPAKAPEPAVAAAPAAVSPPAPAPAPAAAPAPVAAEPAKVVEAARPVEAPKAPKAPEDSKVVAPVAPPAPAEPSKAPEVKKVEAPVKPVASPVAESSMVDQLLADPLPLVGGGGVIALLLGYLLLKRRRSEPEPALTADLSEPSGIAQNSVFRMTGGQSVDTANVPLPNGEFSQMGLASIDTDEVDPVAEADVYMAYGRDAQAEEILIEALRKDPHRTATHVKLFEIYAKNKSVKQFDTLASEFYAQTGGVGPEWERVAAMGAALDPQNPLYSDESRRAKAPAPEVRSAPAVKPSAELDQFSGVAAAAMAAAMVADQAKAEEMQAVVENAVDEDADDSEVALDFDLGGASQLAVEAEMPAIDVIDFDLGGAPAEVSPVAEVAVQAAANEERDFTETLVGFGGPEGLDDATNSAGDSGLAGAAAGDLADFTVDFDIADLQPPAGQEQAAAAVPEAALPEFDLSSINLDLGAGLGEPAAPAPQAVPQSAGSGGSSGEDVSTKLALAKAYDEMGDQDQARELLREVIAEGGGDLADEARAILSRLGG